MSTVLGTGEMALLCSVVCARMQNCFIHPVGGYLGSSLCMRVSCITKAGTQLFPSVAQGQLHFVYFVLKWFLFVSLFVFSLIVTVILHALPQQLVGELKS